MIISRKKYEKKMCEMYDLGMKSINPETCELHNTISLLVQTLEEMADKKTKKEMKETLECALTLAYTSENRARKLYEITSEA